MSNTSTTNETVFLGSFAEAILDAISDQARSSGGFLRRLEILGLLSGTSIFSTYALSCVIMATILNRTAVFASTHNSRRERWSSLDHDSHMGRLWKTLSAYSIIPTLLRLLTMTGFFFGARNCLVALKVIAQNAQDQSTLSTLARLIPAGYFDYDPAYYDQIPYMAMPRNETRIGPTADMLWPVYLSICYSLFIEAFIAAVNGRKPNIVGSISLFELSIDFSTVCPPFYLAGDLAERPSESVLIFALFVLADHIIYHAGCLLYNNKYRLIPQSITNVLFIAYLIKVGPVFPFFTEVIYYCSILIWGLVFVCCGIIALAVLTKGTGAGDLQFATFFKNESDSYDFFSRHIEFRLSDDFYTATMNLGMFALTSAGKSSYITQFNYVNSAQDTWVERLIWKSILSHFGISDMTADSEIVKSGKVLSFFKKSHACGYSNLIAVPSRRLINAGEKGAEENGQSGRMIAQRLAVMKDLAIGTYQLFHSLLVKSFLFYVVPKAFYKYVKGRPISIWDTGEETEEEFLSRKLRAPEFVQKYIKKRDGRNAESIQKVKSFDAFGDFELQSQLEEDDDLLDADYAENMALTDLNLDDDYDLDALDDEDDVLEIDLIEDGGRTHTSALSNEDESLGFLLDLGELISSHNFLDFIKDHSEVLHHHLNYGNPDGHILTRSRYKALFDKEVEKPEPEKLLELILAKRQTREGGMNPDPDSDDYLDSRLACVICQVNMREIITWPCKCFAICEDCRMSVVAKEIQGCVCCRKQVDGVSRVFIP